LLLLFKFVVVVVVVVVLMLSSKGFVEISLKPARHNTSSNNNPLHQRQYMSQPCYRRTDRDSS